MAGDNKKRFGVLKVIAVLLIVLLVAALISPFLVDANRFKPQLEEKISAALGRQVKLGELKLSLLSGSLSVTDISIADNPAFSKSPFVSAKSLKVGVELKPLLFSKSVRVSGITLERPSITLIRSSSGKWNFSDLGATGEAAGKTAAPGESGGFSEKDVSIKELKIVDGQVTIVQGEGKRKPNVYNNVNFTARNLSYSSSFPFSLSASLPGEGTMKLEGKAGPLDNQDIMRTPFSAELDVKSLNLIASGFIAPESGLAGLIDFSGTVVSDGSTVHSIGKAVADRLQLMKNGSAAAKPVSLQYEIDHNLVNRNGSIREASIGAGKAIAHLTGAYEMKGSDLLLKMALNGAGMPLQDLTALLPALGITLPKGASLEGGTLATKLVAEGPVERMIVAGTVEISKTRLVGFDLSGKLGAVASLSGLSSSQVTEIEKFSSGLRLSPEGIQASNLVLILPALGDLNGDGRVAADQSLDFTMRAMLKPGGLIGSGLARIVKGGALDVPFFIRGTASDPKFVPNVKKAAGGLLESVLGRSTNNKEGKTGTGNTLGDTLNNFFKKRR